MVPFCWQNQIAVKHAAKLTAPGVCSALLEDVGLTVEEFFFRRPTGDVEPQPEPEGGRGLTSGITISDDGPDKREVATNSRVGLSFFTLADKASGRTATTTFVGFSPVLGRVFGCTASVGDCRRSSPKLFSPKVPLLG